MKIKIITILVATLTISLSIGACTSGKWHIRGAKEPSIDRMENRGQDSIHARTNSTYTPSNSHKTYTLHQPAPGATTTTSEVTAKVLEAKVGESAAQTWASSAGALLGYELQNAIGLSLDQTDLSRHQKAVEQAFYSHLYETTTWNNEQTGHGGTIKPVREGHRSSNGHLCRQFEQILYIDGRRDGAIGTACQSDDGSWKVLN